MLKKGYCPNSNFEQWRTSDSGDNEESVFSYVFALDKNSKIKIIVP